jgi:exodeoxyribonuclease VII small subunit
MAAKKRSFDFEQTLADLEQLVNTMESGNMPLEESLKAFEQGVKLTRECQQALQEAEQKVTLLLQQGVGVELQPFTPNTDEPA